MTVRYSRTRRSLALFVTCLLVIPFQDGGAFLFAPFFAEHHTTSSSSRILTNRHSSQLYAGKGIATSYTWEEQAFEIEVTVKVPKETRAKDIRFKATPTSVDLRLVGSDHEGGEEVVLLDPSRRLRGKVVLDGTYWTISDTEEASDHREVTVTIEKRIKTAKDDFDVVEYDWNGVYSQDKEEVSYRKYDEPEELDVREYAASLGVDIDNINMSLVDKTMFTSGLNLTKSSLDSLTKSGLAKEVTRQKDGTEWTTNDDGEQVPFSSMGDGVSAGEVQESDASSANKKIPFLDTDSPWHKAVPVKKEERTMDSAAVASTEKAKKRAIKKEQLEKERQKAASDPIDTLTVARLKEILRARGLKVSGNKKELQERLRSEVKTMLTEKDENEATA